VTSLLILVSLLFIKLYIIQSPRGVCLSTPTIRLITRIFVCWYGRRPGQRMEGADVTSVSDRDDTQCLNPNGCSSAQSVCPEIH
jgi:hypothetical protein